MAYKSKTPFSFNFSCPEGTATIGPKRIINARALVELCAYIEDDNKGPVLLDIYVEVDGNKYPLPQAIIFDASGNNAKRYFWQGYKPLSTAMSNLLYIVYTNRSGEDINAVRVTGVVER